jgi:hypothetical protein
MGRTQQYTLAVSKIQNPSTALAKYIKHQCTYPNGIGDQSESKWDEILDTGRALWDALTPAEQTQLTSIEKGL